MSNKAKIMWICIGLFFICPLLPIGITGIILGLIFFLIALFLAIKTNNDTTKRLAKKYDMTNAVIENKESNIINIDNYSMYTQNDKNNEKIVINKIKDYHPNFSKAEFKQLAYLYLKEIIYAFNNNSTSKLKYIETKELYQEHLKQIQNKNIDSIFPKTINFYVVYSTIMNYQKTQELETIEYKITLRTIAIPNTQEIPHIITYTIHLIKPTSLEETETVISNNCPNCMAPIDIGKNNCEYCGQEVNTIKSDWKVSKIKRWEKGD